LQDMIRRIVEADSQAKRLDEENKKAAEREKRRIEEEAAAIYQKYMDQAIASRRSLISNEIKKLRNGYKIKPFSIVYEMVTASDQIMFSVKITE